MVCSTVAPMSRSTRCVILPCRPSPWASILTKSKDFLYTPGGLLNYWWLFLPVTLAIVLFGVAWNILGDGINDALNPAIVDKTRL